MGMFASNPRPVLDFKKDKGRTKQAHKGECDINNIIARYQKTGHLTHINRNQGTFADVSEVDTFQAAIDRVRGTEKFFFGLSAEVRAVFENDPAQFLDFIASATTEELNEYGLAPLREKAEDPPSPPRESETPSNPEAEAE